MGGRGLISENLKETEKGFPLIKFEYDWPHLILIRETTIAHAQAFAEITRLINQENPRRGNKVPATKRMTPNCPKCWRRQKVKLVPRRRFPIRRWGKKTFP